MRKLLWAMFVVVLVTACSQQHESAPAGNSQTHVAEPGDVRGGVPGDVPGGVPGGVIDQKLMVALSQAKNLHHKAKLFASDGNVDDAIGAVRQILSLQFPAGAPEAEDVRADARALLAKMLVSKGNLDEAMRVVTEGLAASTRDSFFVANLYTVQGEIHEARAATLQGAPAAQVADEKRAAIAAYDKSIEIDDKLQKQLTESQ